MVLILFYLNMKIKLLSWDSYSFYSSVQIVTNIFIIAIENCTCDFAIVCVDHIKSSMKYKQVFWVHAWTAVVCEPKVCLPELVQLIM